MSGSPLPRCVIFDVDGVLVRSMESHYEAYRRVMAAEGINIEQHEVYANEGRRSREVLESLAKDRGLGYDAAKLEALNAEKQRIFASFGPQPTYPGVPELLDKLHARGMRLAMVTGTNRANVQNHLRDLVPKFDAVVTADDVTHTKPHPEPYLTALEKLGVEAKDAVVVENAVFGIRSAKAAGIRVIAVTSTLSADELHQADIVVARVDEVDRALEELS